MNMDNLFNQRSIFIIIGAEAVLAFAAPVTGLGNFGAAVGGGVLGVVAYHQFGSEGGVLTPNAVIAAMPAGIGAAIGHSVSSDPHQGAMIGAAVTPFLFNLFGISIDSLIPQA